MGGARMKTRKFVYGAAFLLPVGLYLTVLFAARVIPLGGNSLLLWDANHFYAAFLEYWRGALLSQQDFFYSFSRALGQSMAGLAGFFLLSPLNFLLLLFPEGAMPLFFSVLILLKIGLCGLTFAVFLQKRYQSGREGLIFSTSYALMGFVAVYAFHVMWLDALILLPLVALGIHKIAAGGKPFLYITALGLAVVCQYYVGYMVCLFSALYFLYLSLENHAGFRVFLRRLCRFAGASVLSAGLAAAVLIPAVYAVSRGYALFDSSMLTLDSVGSVLGLLTKAYTASVGIEQLKSGGPNFYIGIPLLVFALLYFACRAVALRKRLLSLGFAAVFLFSFLFAAPYTLWHAFNTPNFFPARFSFLFSFLLLEIAWQGYRNIESLSNRRLIVTCAAAAAGFLALTAVVLTRMQSIEYLAVKTVVMDAAFFCITCLLIFQLRVKRRRTIAVVILCAMQAVCLLLNAYYPIVRLNRIWSSTASAYTEETERGRALVDRVKAGDNGLYRMELDFHRTDTDPFAYDYSGLTHFSPDADEAAIEFFDKLGLRQDYYHIRYASGTTPVLESLFGLKYILRKDGVALGPLPEGYEFLWRDGDVSAYQNAYALPFAYLAPEQARELSNGNPFVNQNTLLTDLTGEEAAVFEPVADVERTYDGTWENYTFPVQANRRLYMKSFGADYVLNGAAESADRLNGTILLPVSDAYTTYEVKMTAPLGMDLAYFDDAAFQRAHSVLAAHAAEVSSDTDSHLVIHANVTDDHTQLIVTLPFDEGWRVWVDGERAETTARYGALLAVNLSSGEHTVELRFVPDGLWAGVAVSTASLLLVILWACLTRKRKEKR
jgi:uncharacterized membrane protein YfhO